MVLVIGGHDGRESKVACAEYTDWQKYKVWLCLFSKCCSPIGSALGNIDTESNSCVCYSASKAGSTYPVSSVSSKPDFSTTNHKSPTSSSPGTSFGNGCIETTEIILDNLEIGISVVSTCP